KNPVIFNEVAFNTEEGAALTLPLRLHLKNPFFGASCYIGSESNPLLLHLTVGQTNPPKGYEPLRGKLGEPETLEEKEEPVLRVSGNLLVDNTFSAPEAEGCGEPSGKGKGSLDATIDEKLKIPDEAGENTAILGGALEIATLGRVVASESWPAVPTLSPPVLGGLRASGVTQFAAVLNGTLQTGEAPVHYHFEYGVTTATAQSRRSQRAARRSPAKQSGCPSASMI